MSKEYLEQFLEQVGSDQELQAKIENQLDSDGNISIEIYNLQGRRVEILANRYMEAGYHSVVWNADRHASGIYFVKLMTLEFTKTQKLMLVK